MGWFKGIVGAFTAAAADVSFDNTISGLAATNVQDAIDELDAAIDALEAGDVEGPASATDNAIARFDGTTGKLIQNSLGIIDDGGNISATNLSGTNTGDQTSIVGISGTKTEYNASLSDGDFLFVGDVTQYTDEMAQDAIGAMIDSTLVYVDATPLLTRAALTGDVTASQGSNATTIANDAVTFAKMQNIVTDSLIGRDTAGSGDPENILLNSTLSMDGSGNLQRAALTGDVTASAGSNATTIPNDTVTFAKFQNIVDNRLLGRSAGSTGDMMEITVGTGLSLSAGTLSNTITQYTTENAQDDVGGILTDTATIDFTYSDATPSITADVINDSITYAKMQNFSAFSLIANNTNAAADAAEQVFNQPGSQTYASTITWAGVTAPSGTTSHAYNWSQVGKMVQFAVMLTYGTAGTANTGVTIAFPSDLPAPLEWAGLTAATDKLYAAAGQITALTSSGPANTAAAIRRNAADTGYEFILSVASVGARQAIAAGFYFTS